jgi:hypothetical protein
MSKAADLIINDKDMFIDRLYELETLKRYLANRMCCQIVGPAGIGKSSLLLQLARIARTLSPTFSIAYVQLRNQRSHTVGGFLEILCTALGKEVVGSTHELAIKIDKWQKEGNRLVFCLDDFEELTSRPGEFTSDFFLDMRFVAQQGVSFVTASRVPLSSLFPGISPVSPFFGLFAVLHLGPLGIKDIGDFIARAVMVPPLADPEREMIAKFCRGYPLRLETALQFVEEGRRAGEALTMSLEKAEQKLSGDTDKGIRN